MEKYIPLDKSWIIRMGVLDLVNNKNEIISFLNNQDNLGDDLIALKRVAENWNSSLELDVGESGTLYRFIRFALWKLGKENKIIKRGTLVNRNITDDSKIVNLSLNELLKLDNGTSQWASASVLLGNTERVENPPTKLTLSYKAVEHWTNSKIWNPKSDKTIEKQARAFLDLLKTGKIDFIPEHSEDYCFARAFNLLDSKEGERRFPSLRGHETDRIVEMEKAIQQADNNIPVDSKDHRVIQAIAMRQREKGKNTVIVNKNVVNKTWPQFWDFLNRS